MINAVCMLQSKLPKPYVESIDGVCEDCGQKVWVDVTVAKSLGEYLCICLDCLKERN